MRLSNEERVKFREIWARWEAGGGINPHCPTKEEQQAMDTFEFHACEDMEFLMKIITRELL